MTETAPERRPPSRGAPAPGPRRRLPVPALCAFVLALLFFAFLYAPSPLIYDADSYYHLAVARHYAQHGLSPPPEGWVRHGLLARQFGDKEVLFHLLLAPFTLLPDPALGGRLALGLLGALILALVAHLAVRAAGPWGALVPFWLVVSSTEIGWRLVRLRPELLSLLLLLLALWAAGRRRYRLLGLVAFAYALSYTAIHAFVGLFALCFVVEVLRRGRWPWPLVLYPVLGAGLGLLAHPHFPDNLAVWWFQSVEYFRFKGTLDVGTEIRPNFTDVTLMVNLGWFLGLAILWRSTRPAGEGDRKSSGRPGASPAGTLPEATPFGVGAVVFGLLYLLMSRFSVYFLPLATLWLLFAARGAGRGFTSRTALPWRGRVPAAVAWAACVAISLPVARGELERYRQRTDPGPGDARVREGRLFAAAVPAGAPVAAPWRSTPLYLYWAPQGRYLNVLDPMFLAATEPEVHAAQRRVFKGDEPDVPRAAAVTLGSRYLAFPTPGSRRLSDRLAADPRLTPLLQGSHNLFRIEPDRQAGFVLDWRLAPAGVDPARAGAAAIESWAEYPRSSDPVGRRVEGFVDAARAPAAPGCAGFARLERLETARRLRYELAPWGPAAVWWDGELLAESGGGAEAVPGRGVFVEVVAAAGAHRLAVRSCPGEDGGRNGFYLLRRDSVELGAS